MKWCLFANSFRSITKEDGSRPKAHRRSGTADGCDIGLTSTQHYQSTTDDLSPPLPPPPPISVSAVPSRGKMSSSASASSEGQNSSSAFSHLTRGRGHNDNRQDTCGYASTAPFSSPTHSNVRASSPSKNSRGQESMSTPVTSTHATVESNMKRCSIESGPAAHCRDESGGQPQFPSQYRHQIFEDPDMTDASSSIYSMDELIKAIPHIHPLYVKRIAEMGSPSRSPGLSPEQSPTTLHEYTA